MVMSWVWTALVGISILCAAVNGQGTALASAVLSGAQAGIEVGIAIAGALCLWSGVGVLMERSGLTAALSWLLAPILRRIFPSAARDPVLAGHLSGNICANILGLGNAATPMGIRATKAMIRQPGIATDEMCRLIVLNTASIQLIPGNVAAIRASLGAVSPFDILPAVWITSLCSAGLGLTAAFFLGKVWRHD
ncbi:MAG: spore maturation protein A [Ruminococcaceae bacterium]|nr:spore maturation protein A [Oscillospiraceae bacterium]